MPKSYRISIENYSNAFIEVVHLKRTIQIHLFLNGKKIPSDAMLILEKLSGVPKYPYLRQLCKFKSRDYFQQTFESHHSKLKLGHHIHEFIIKNKSSVFNTVNRIYSTNNLIDSKRHSNLKISISAKKFWKKRVKLKSAKYSFFKGRYFIKWS